jgi:hypothetical protein
MMRSERIRSKQLRPSIKVNKLEREDSNEKDIRKEPFRKWTR